MRIREYFAGWLLAKRLGGSERVNRIDYNRWGRRSTFIVVYQAEPGFSFTRHANYYELIGMQALMDLFLPDVAIRIATEPVPVFGETIYRR